MAIGPHPHPVVECSTFVAELLEVMGEWREGIDSDPVTQYAKGAAEAEQRIIDKLDEMLTYCGVVPATPSKGGTR